ncbi:cell division protein FtsI/penicillin-binding protein 2 [Paenibacillus shirakamiensis]|uniref:Cell division protein FtsI/penicillin-binding protein 2 n=1 Tax=Paenibacillus shirakamiensis TaxID=1265935 RepID=A0ABS4JBE4_9BACL|nr:penicillin-binding transpeptidase domain-containing protein [Paenibacillus shirakamiensis]MBP1999038.1 cell division protein FtsI/penicillin-binding protein 2 [Paenibacillus shirakamiensis]
MAAQGVTRLEQRKRILWVLILLTSLLLLLAVRLGWIQWMAARKNWTAAGYSLNEMAVRQRQLGIQLDSGRGHFTDRHGHLLTGHIKWSPVLFPIHTGTSARQMQRAAALLHTSEKELSHTWSTIKQPYIWKNIHTQTADIQPSKEWTNLGIAGVALLPFAQRYPSTSSGSQWLGFISERPDYVVRAKGSLGTQHLPTNVKVGSAGLERSFDSLLQSQGVTEAMVMVDGRKQPLPKTPSRISSPTNHYYPLRLRTTIDQGIQSRLEQMTENMHMKEGAIVVLDAHQGDIVAMVSRPFFNPQHIELDQGNWSNRAVKAAVPGSIFKSIIAAAALDTNKAKPSENFECHGDYGKYNLSCSAIHGHGRITLEEGFAKSCNIVFASLGERLTSQEIERTADQLGMGRKIGWQEQHFLGGGNLQQIDQEERGVIFAKANSNTDGGTRAQAAIGQRDVLVTPLQAANLVVTLLHGGKVMSPRLVSEIRYADGSLMASLEPHTSISTQGKVSGRTSKKLLRWMREVVTEGTGKSLQNAKWNLAGKSGTAQVERSGHKLNDQWFIGYGPTEQPKYAVAVLVQSRTPGSEHQATAVFKEAMNQLAR